MAVQRILFILQELPAVPDRGQVGGAAKSPFRLLRYLAPALKEVRVIAFAGNSRTLPANCVARVFLLSWAKLYLRTLLRNTVMIPEILRWSKKVQVIQCHHPHLGGAVALCKQLHLISTPFIVKAHGMALPEFESNEHTGIRYLILSMNSWIHAIHDRYVLRHADLVLCSSRFQLKEMVDVYRVDSARLRVIYNGFDPEVRDCARKRSRKKDGGQQGKAMVFCGRPVDKKNAQYAINIFECLQAEGSLQTLYLVLGQSRSIENPKVYDAIVRRVRSNGSIKLLHDLPEEALYETLMAADVGIVPSLRYESIPSIIYEMAAAGLPVFATGQWGITEILREEFYLSGDLKRDSEAIKRVIRENRGLGTEALKVPVETFGYNNLSSEYADIYSAFADITQ
jgi:glycosyltransferase involved in cell wall biosynthesis